MGYSGTEFVQKIKPSFGATLGRIKKFIPIYFVTNDPKFTFSGGSRAGADVKVLERLL